MLLHVHPLVTEVKQAITVGERPMMVHAISIYLYRHLAPAGSLYVEIQDSTGKRIKVSETIAISAIGDQTKYFHGFYRFLISVPLKADTTYYVALKATGGYAFSELAYIGWGNAWAFKNSFPVTYSAPFGKNAPLALRVWEQRFISKGDQ